MEAKDTDGADVIGLGDYMLDVSLKPCHLSNCS